MKAIHKSLILTALTALLAIGCGRQQEVGGTRAKAADGKSEKRQDVKDSSAVRKKQAKEKVGNTPAKAPKGGAEPLGGKIDGKTFSMGAGMARYDADGMLLVFISDERDPRSFSCSDGQIVNSAASEEESMREWDHITLRVNGSDSEVTFFSATTPGENDGGMSFPADEQSLKVEAVTQTLATIHVYAASSSDGESAVKGRVAVPLCR
jgi:hypothetical protein